MRTDYIEIQAVLGKCIVPTIPAETNAVGCVLSSVLDTRERCIQALREPPAKILDWGSGIWDTQEEILVICMRVGATVSAVPRLQYGHRRIAVRISKDMLGLLTNTPDFILEHGSIVWSIFCSNQRSQE